MDYKMNLGNELAQIKHCKSEEEIFQFIKEHNLDPRYVSYTWDKRRLVNYF